MDRDVHRDGGHGPRQGAPLGIRRRRVQVEIRWGGVAAAACPLRNVIFSAHYRETANCGGGSHDIRLAVLPTVP